MLSLFKRGAGGMASSESGEANFDLTALADLINCFPIGKRLKYYPEFKDALKLESILLGYMINDRVLFSAADLRVRREADAVEILLADGKGGATALRTVTSFAFVVPDSNADAHLDYMSRAELDRVGCFRPGNAITLISTKHVNGTASLDTEVHSIQTMRDGVYAKHRLALLVPQADSLRFSEQRQYQRVEVRVPVTLKSQSGEQHHDCTLIDFSETSVRVEFARDSELAATLRDGRQMALTLALGDRGRRYVLDGKVRRAGDADNCLIMAIGRVEKNGHFKPFTMLDALDIKAGLLDFLGDSTRAE